MWRGLQFRGEDADVSALRFGLSKDTFIHQPITVSDLAEWYFEIIEDHLGLADGLLVLPIGKKTHFCNVPVVTLYQMRVN